MILGGQPVPGDYDGDGTDEPAGYYPTHGQWYFADHSWVQFGQRGDVPVPRDYNGDGVTDLAVYRPSTRTWIVRGLSTTQFGEAAELVVPRAPIRERRRATTTATRRPTSACIALDQLLVCPQPARGAVRHGGRSPGARRLQRRRDPRRRHVSSVARPVARPQSVPDRFRRAGRHPCARRLHRRRPHRPCVLPSVDRHVARPRLPRRAVRAGWRHSRAGRLQRRRHHRHGGLPSLDGRVDGAKDHDVQFGDSTDFRFRPTTTKTASSTSRSTGPRPACGTCGTCLRPSLASPATCRLPAIRPRPPYGAGGVPAVDGTVVRAKSVRRAVRGRRGYAGRAHRRKPVIPYRRA